MIKNMYGSSDSRFSKTASKVRLGVDALDKASQKLALEGKHWASSLSKFLEKNTATSFVLSGFKKKIAWPLIKAELEIYPYWNGYLEADKDRENQVSGI